MKNDRNRTAEKLFVQISVITLIFLMFFLSAAGVSAQDSVMRRYALYVGANYGGRDRVTLSYAVTDARTLSDVMNHVGGVSPSDSIILNDPSPELVNRTVRDISRKIQGAQGVKRSEFFFYYSGHSDEKGLLLGEDVYRYQDLKDVIDSVGADVNIAVLDSCSSGSFTRMKGGVRRSPFLSDESVVASGHAFLTSSSENEAAQESDELGASFFTHYLVTALRGAADSTQDGTVSLNEAYSYAAAETLARTEETLAGPQHPSYDIRLAGTGDLVLTDLRAVSEKVQFEKELKGRIFIRDRAGRLVVELRKIEGAPLAVSIGPGSYSMILDDGSRLLSANLVLTGGSHVLVARNEFFPVPGSVNTVRGGSLTADSTGAGAATYDDEVSGTAAELDVIAERARARALETQSVYPEIETSEQVSNRETGLRIGFITGSDSLDGIQVAAIGAHVRGGLNGFQAAGIYSSVDGELKGAQISGVWNEAGDVSFFQSAGVFNTAEGNVTGLQSAGVFNTAGGSVTGGQASGVFNTAGDVIGIQASGVFNTAADVDGIQASGVFNVAEDVRGVQAGLLNFGGKVYGLQVGLVNISEELHGVPLGLINISGNGLNNFSAWYTDTGFFNLGYQLGTPSVYTFMNLGVSGVDVNQAASFGLGMGFEFGSDLLYADVDVYSKAYAQGQGTAAANFQSIFTEPGGFFPALRLTAGVELFGFLSLFGGFEFDCRIYGSYEGVNFDIGPSDLTRYQADPAVIDFNGQGALEMYPSLFFGLRL